MRRETVQFVCLCVRVFVCLFVCLLACLFVCLCMCGFVWLSVCLTACLPSFLPACLLPCLFDLLCWLVWFWLLVFVSGLGVKVCSSKCSLCCEAQKVYRSLSWLHALRRPHADSWLRPRQVRFVSVRRGDSHCMFCLAHGDAKVVPALGFGRRPCKFNTCGSEDSCRPVVEAEFRRQDLALNLRMSRSYNMGVSQK